MTTATPDATAEVEPTTIEWLLDGDAAIRWQTRRDLLDEPASAYTADREAVATTGWGRRLLELQDTDGTWAGGLYGPKWTSTTYTLLLLRHCGLLPGNPAALRGVQAVWDGARYFGNGLTPAATIDFPEGCVTSMYICLAKYFGFEDPRVDAAVSGLLENQLDDGGWNCRTVRFGDRHGSFHTSILALEALTEVDRAQPGQAGVIAAIEKGRAFFLAHRLYKSHRTGEPAAPAFTKLSFPPRWHYDILRGLDYFASIGSPWDYRYEDAFDLLIARRRKDGTWPAQNKHYGDVWFDFEPARASSRWNTLRSLRVLRWHERATGTP